jgi:uncharacterized protein YgiM (DUF1202 family)
MGVVFILPAAAQDNGIPATVYQTVNVRSGPDTRFEIVGQLSRGDTVTVVGRDENGRWLQVMMDNGDIGWLPLFVLTLEGVLDEIPVVGVESEGTPPAGGEVTVVAYGRVNVRTEPALNGEIIGQLDVGDEAQATARSNDNNDWLLIENDSIEGWVAFFTVRVQGDLESLPILVPDSSGEDLIPPTTLLRALFNARLHPVPELNSPTTVIVPFDSEVTPIARTEDGRWLLLGYNEQTGWGIAELFDVTDEQLEDIPIFMPDEPEATPEATPQAEGA